MADDISNLIQYSVYDDSPIVINIGGGSDVSNSNGDYFFLVRTLLFLENYLLQLGVQLFSSFSDIESS